MTTTAPFTASTTASTGSRDIVRRAGTAPDQDDERVVRDRWRAEHLAVPGTGHLHVASLPSEDDITGQLARRVAGDPTDARLHVARVNHHMLQNQPDLVFAALLDVFYAFGTEGAGLRKRLLEGVRRMIGLEHAARLDLAVADGIRPECGPPWCAGSVLSQGITGTTDIVRPVRQGARR